MVNGSNRARDLTFVLSHHLLPYFVYERIGGSCETAQTRPQGYKTFFMLNSTENEILTAHKNLKYRQVKKFLASNVSDVVFIMLINVKMPTFVGIFTLKMLKC